MMMMTRTQTPLTLDQIRAKAPSAFATEPWEGMSQRYAYIPTSDVIQGLMEAGLQPFAASQSRTRIAGKREHTKHMIRFRPSTAGEIAVQDTFPEVVLINSHDGSSAYKLMAGLFRLVCSNGMIVADSMIGSVNVRHTGDVIQEAAQASAQIVEHLPRALSVIEDWKQIELTADEQGAFAAAAHQVRFADSDGKVNTPIQPHQLLQTRRMADCGQDLWTTFNRVQENVIQGGLTARRPGSRRRTSTRRVNGIDQDVRLNRALWTLGERMAELKGMAA